MSDGAASIILEENGDHRPRLSGRFDCLCMGLQAQRLFRLLEAGVTINIVFLKAWEARRTLTSLGVGGIHWLIGTNDIQGILVFLAGGIILIVALLV
jgi:hypothetical protein